MGDELGLPAQVECPFCGKRETELHSPFGTALSVATYWCRRCRTAFEWVKWGAPEEASTSGDQPAREAGGGPEDQVGRDSG